jgi:hypothetical protein
MTTTPRPYVDLVFDADPRSTANSLAEIVGPDGEPTLPGLWIAPDEPMDSQMWILRLTPADVAGTDTATREAVAAAIEAKLGELVVSVSAGFRGHLEGMPEPVVEHLARIAVAVVASSFGSDVSDEQINGAVSDAGAAADRLVSSLFPSVTNVGGRVDAWIVGIRAVNADGSKAGFGMLTDNSPDFDHSAIAGEIVYRIAGERHATGS